MEEQGCNQSAAVSGNLATDGSLFRRVVADGYDKCADAYLAHVSEDDGKDDMRLEPLGRMMAALPPGAHVLDAGCGAGVPVSRLVVEHPGRMRVTGVDISRRQIELAIAHVGGLSDRASFVCADITAAAFEPSSFDGVCAFFSIFHVPRREHGELFRLIASWLKPDGWFVFNLDAGDESSSGEASTSADFLGAEMVWSSHPRDATVRLLSEAGLALVHEELKTNAADDAVDDAGMRFRFYTCRKSSAKAGGVDDGAADAVRAS